MIHKVKFRLAISLLTIFTLYTNLDGQNYVCDRISTHSVMLQDITVDKYGNEYSAGVFWKTGNFGSLTSITSLGATDIFIQKRDSSNKLIWVKTIGYNNSAQNMENVYNIEVDDSGNVYTTGDYNGFDLDPNSGVKKINGSGVFLLKLNDKGVFKGASLLGDTTSATVNCLNTVLRGKYIYVVGNFANQINFKQGTGTYNINANGTWGYVAKYDLNGNFVWVKTVAGKLSNNNVSAVYVDENDQVFITGLFLGDATFDYPLYTNKISAIGGASDQDMFLARLNKNGTLDWVKSFGSYSKSEIPNALVGDKNGYVYLGGSFRSIMDFDPSSSVEKYSPKKIQDGFLSKFASNGDFIKVARLESSSVCDIIDIVIHDNGDIIFDGHLSLDIDFDPSSNEAIYKAYSGYQNFHIGVLDDKLNIRWGKVFGSTAGGTATVIRLNFKQKQNEIMISGYYPEFMFYAPGRFLGSTSYGSLYFKNCSTVIIDKVTACDYYQWKNKITYRKNQKGVTYSSRTPFTCDSFVTLDLTVNPSYIDTLTVSACDEFKWVNNETYTQSAIIQSDRLNTIHGCDSFLVLNLTINKSSIQYDVIESCDSITWIDGKKYNSNNSSAYVVLRNFKGCDSTIRLNFSRTIINSDIDTNGGTLISKEQEANKFQWLDCANSWKIISGENSKNFNPGKSGTFGVEIQKNGCIDTSNCVFIDVTNIKQNENINFQLFPNPTTNQIYFNTTADKIEIYDIHGVYQNSFCQSSAISLLSLPKGMYCLNINHLGKNYSRLVLLQ